MSGEIYVGVTFEHARCSLFWCQLADEISCTRHRLQAINSTREAAKPVAECTDNTVELVVSINVASRITLEHEYHIITHGTSILPSSSAAT